MCNAHKAMDTILLVEFHKLFWSSESVRRLYIYPAFGLANINVINCMLISKLNDYQYYGDGIDAENNKSKTDQNCLF